MADTNVLVAAAIAPRGVCGYLLAAAIEHRWRPLVSPQLISELSVVLHRTKFRTWLTQTEARQFTADIQAMAHYVPDPPAASTPTTTDPDDEYLLTLARHTEAIALISGDAHLTHIPDPRPPVMTPVQFRDYIPHISR